MQYFIYIIFITLLTFKSYALTPIPNPSAILDAPGKFIKEIIKAYKKKREDEHSQNEYEEDFKKFDKEDESNDVLDKKKKELLQRFEGIWDGFLNIKFENQALECKIEIFINKSSFEDKFICDQKEIKIKINIGLSQNLEESFIIIGKSIFYIYGDISSFGNKDKEIKIIGNFTKS